MAHEFVHDGVHLAYDTLGPESAPPLLLLHGLASSRDSWCDVAPRLAATWRVFVLDHRGHGDSGHTPNEYRLEHYGADALAFIDTVIGGPVAVVGHSLGGLVAAWIASRSPHVQRAFLEDPPLYFCDKAVFDASMFALLFPLAQQALRDARDRDAPIEELVALAAAIPALNGDGSMADMLGPDKTRMLASAWKRFDPEAFTAALDGSLFAGFDVDRRIDVPLRLLRAERTLGAAFFEQHEQHFLDTHADASADLVPGATHDIHTGHLGEFMDDLERFLAAP